MKPFDYVRPTDVATAMSVMTSTPGAVYLAGGTNLVDLMKLGVSVPTTLVDVGHLGLDAVEVHDDGGVRIGAAVRNSHLSAHPVVRRDFPVLAQALVNGASGQLRNMATVGGNLLQRTRCAYFQDTTTPCNKRRPGSGCPAREGDHRNLAILGGSPSCIATHPSDMAVAMVALNATLNIRSPGGARTLDLADLYLLPGDTPERETVLEPGWLIESVDLLPPGRGTRSGYRKVRDRASFAFAVTAVAAVVELDDGRVRDLRVALGAVAPRPWRARTAEDVIRGEQPARTLFDEAITAELDAAAPLRDNAYKLQLVRNVTVRLLSELCGVDTDVDR